MIKDNACFGCAFPSSESQDSSADPSSSFSSVIVVVVGGSWLPLLIRGRAMRKRGSMIIRNCKLDSTISQQDPLDTC